MAKLNLDDYCGADLYSDGDVEEEILELVRSGREIRPGEDVAFPVLYHLSKIRENILNWYPFRAGSCCLEIGSGCGAITGLLCDRLEKVTSVDLSRRRARINYERHRDRENLEIRVGNLNSMKFESGFDYVILNGVFEYAIGFTPGEKPYETFLNRVKQLLAPNGVILVAIENRLGMKYFAGAPEDHTDGYFDGIMGYRENPPVRTFSMAEWEGLMKSCGLSCYRFYYPYPDYKFPKEIFTDETLKEQIYGRPSWNFNDGRMIFLSETELAAQLQKEGLINRFANSFLIEMSCDPLPTDERVEYAKLSTDRAKRFAIATVIRSREAESGKADAEDGIPGANAGRVRTVCKRAMMPEAQKHIESMLRDIGQPGTWEPLKGAACEGGICYPYLEKESLGQKAAKAADRGDIAALRDLMGQVARICRNQTGIRKKGSELTPREKREFARVFGEGEVMEDALCVAPANIDLILDNIFETDGSYQVIDCEWVFDFPVPATFLIWRAVNELYSVRPWLEKLYPEEDFLGEYDITPEMAAVFWNWATYFTEQYVGANRLLNRSVPGKPLPLRELMERIRSRERLTCALYLDTGRGFSQEEMLVQSMQSSGREFCVTFDLSGIQGIRSLRFDPLEGWPCICRIDGEKTSMRLTAQNAAARTGQGDLFLTTDPIYLIKGKPIPGRLTIAGSVTVFSMEEALQRADRLLGKGSLKKKLKIREKG